jgi:colicin import membrane protein/protein TonB
MALPVPSALSRRDRLWPAVGVSAAVHVALIAWAILRPAPPPIDLEQKAIVAKLVRLGPKKPEQYLPTKESPPAPPPPAAAPVPVPVAPVAPPRAEPSPSARAKPAPAQVARPAPGAAGGRPGGSSLASILQRVERETARERWGDPDGDPGGDAESGSEGDRYLGLVVQELKRNYEVPKTIPPQDLAALKATVILRIDTNGRISSHDFERRSGNASYDAALSRAISRTQLPPPPPELRAHYARVGLGVNFHL